MEYKIKASVIAGCSEILITYPLDYLKILYQNNNKMDIINIKRYMRTPYKGVSSKMVGFVPMRLVFWTSLDYFNSKGYNPIMSGIYTSIIQTTLDYPIEQTKIYNINKKLKSKKYSIFDPFRSVRIVPSIGYNLTRNMVFALIVNGIIQKDPKSLYYGALGGLAGSLVTQPLDSLKTWYQSGNVNFPKHWKINNYMKGYEYRCLVSLIGINIGWVVFSNLNSK